MRYSASHPYALIIGVAALLACHDERPQPHVFGTPPPVPPHTAESAASAAEVPLGSTGPEARITGVTDAGTGVPVAYTGIVHSVDVMTLVAHGPGSWPGGSRARVELTFRGPTDTVLVYALDPPAPAIVAHAFRIDAGGESNHGLRPGFYAVAVRLVTAGGRVLVTSVPLHVTVGP